MKGAAAGLAINIMLFPVILWQYFQFSTYSVLVNMVVVPVISAVLGLAVLGSGLLLFLRPIGVLFLSACDVLLDLCELLNLLCGKLPDLDCVSIGPDLMEIHTPRERMSVASVQRVWAFVLEVLKRSR